MKDSLHPESEPGSTRQSRCQPEDDLRALKRRSEQDLPEIEDTVRALAERQAASSREGLMTALVRKAKTGPRMVPLVAGALAALLLLIPFSYERTTSYDVKLTLGGAPVDGAQTQKIATEFRKALHAPGVQIQSAGGGVELTANVPAAQAAGVGGIARAFAAELKSRHLDAEATVSAVKTKVQGNVYAMAMSRVINVNVETTGRSDDEIASDIRNQLAAAGLEVTDVEYQTDGDRRTVKITAENNDPNASSMSGAACADVNVTLDGQAPAAGSHQVKVKLEKQPGDTDESIRQRILDQFHAQGLDANVVVQNGKVVSIEPIKP